MKAQAVTLCTVLSALIGLCTAFGPVSQDARPARVATLPGGSTLVERDGPCVVWSPDGKRAAWVAERGGELLPMWTSVDGVQIGEAHQFVEQPAFSDDSAHVIFSVGDSAGKNKQRWSLVIDGEDQEQQDWLGGAHFWPGTDTPVFWIRPGARVAKNGGLDGGSFVLRVGKRKGRKWIDAEVDFELAYSLDGSHGAALVKKGTRSFVLVANGKKQDLSKLELATPTGLVMSPDGSTWSAAEWIGAGERGSTNRDLTGDWVVRRLDDSLACEQGSADLPSFCSSSAKLAYRVTGDAGVGVGIEGGSDALLDYAAVQEIVWEQTGENGVVGEEGLGIVALAKPDPEATGLQYQVFRMDGAGQVISAGPVFAGLRDLTLSKGGVSHLNLAYCVKLAGEREWRLVREWTEGGALKSSVSEPFDYVGPPFMGEDGQFKAGVVQGEHIMVVTAL